MSGDQVGALLPLLLLVAVFWLLVLRPARNRQRQAAALQSELAVGSDVMLTSGMVGKVTWLGEETARVEIAPETTVRVHRQAIGRVLGSDETTRMASESSDLSEPADDTDSVTTSSDTPPPDSAQSDKGD